MSDIQKCEHCGSSEIEVHSGETVCVSCGSILGAGVLVSEVQFEECGQGGSRLIGQFVSADSTGPSGRLGANLNFRSSSDSREATLRKAKNGISMICLNLSLSSVYIDRACNLYKLALTRGLTKRRRNTHVYAACVYIICRTEELGYLLIDISDILKIDCFELGRTYLKLSQELFINIPAIDPCIYILRFASKLQFGNKTQQVANTALRLVQRMKKDCIHYGRKPTGLCGAALLIAARLHEFGRTTEDIIKIVKVHESTLKKRLIEFGETPSSALSLDEFMTVDLEGEQDPPSFKAARKKDKERLQRLMNTESEVLSDLQKQIEEQLEQDRKKRPKPLLLPFGCPPDALENQEEDVFIEKSTLETINNLIPECVKDSEPQEQENTVGLGPNILKMGLPTSLEDTTTIRPETSISLNILDDFNDIDDDEIDSYILTEQEYSHKNKVWLQRNSQFLEEQKEREERRKKEEEEGKRKKRKKPTKKNTNAASSAKEAIERIIHEKKISSKINYDVLKCLTAKTEVKKDEKVEEPIAKRQRLSSVASNCSEISALSQKLKPPVVPVKGKAIKELGLPLVTEPEEKEEEHVAEDVDDDDDSDEEPVEEENEAFKLFRQLNGAADEEDDYEDENDCCDDYDDDYN